MKTLLHVDMDAFFASAELLAHPEWRGKPLVVGSGPHERGVVSTCSYEARKYGIHSAMPSRRAYQLCPHAIFTRPNMALYEETSRKAFEIFETFTPYVEGVSIDEAFLDITGSIHLYGNARTLGDALRKKIEKECSVTCSVGIAPNRLLAKIGSEENKPNGLTVMPFNENEIASFLAPKPISIIWGVGGKTNSLLKRYGLTTCGAIQRTSLSALEKILGSRNAAETLKSHSFGISDDTVYWQEREEKSVSNENTFGEDECNREVVRTTLLELAAKVGRRFRGKKLAKSHFLNHRATILPYAQKSLSFLKRCGQKLKRDEQDRGQSASLALGLQISRTRLRYLPAKTISSDAKRAKCAKSTSAFQTLWTRSTRKAWSRETILRTKCADWSCRGT